MSRFKFMRSDISTGSLTSRERRELRHLERHAEHEHKEQEHARELVAKAREMRQEQGKHKKHGSFRLIVLLVIVAALIYGYIKYFR